METIPTTRPGLMQKKERARGNGAADLERARKGRGGARRACLARGMRVHRKRGEQLLSCQLEPLNLPADLLTIVPASSYHHRFAFFSCPLVSAPPLPVISSAPRPRILRFRYPGIRCGRFGVARFANGDACSRFSRVFHRSRFEWNV